MFTLFKVSFLNPLFPLWEDTDDTISVRLSLHLHALQTDVAGRVLHSRHLDPSKTCRSLLGGDSREVP